MEFIAKIPDNLPEIIENNGEEVKAWLSDVMQKYDGLIVTPESIKSAKDDKAKLNKLRTALEERRKEVKRDYLAPYMKFEEKYKEILALIDKPISAIDSQIKALDEQEQNLKYAHLQVCFEDYISAMNVPIDVNFDRILNPKWKNKTMKADTLENEIRDTLCRIRNDVKELQDYYAESPHFTAIMDCYKQSYDKSCALAYAAALIQQEQRRQEAQRAAQQPVREPEPTPPPAYEPTPEPPVQPQNEPKITGVFRVTGTRSQIIALRDFMRANHIEFQIVKEK
jgi:hypothetical protein